jgi:hypothetical protein
MTVTVNITNFWDVTLCSQVKVHRHFRGMRCIHLDVQTKSQATGKQSKNCIDVSSLSAGTTF